MGTNNSATDAAAAADAARQAAIAKTVGSINTAYSSPNRQAQYATYGQNLNSYYTGQVNDQEAINARNLKFAMARSGLSGGSAAVDSNTQLQKDYTKGLLQASQAAQGGTAALEQSDINAKNQLTSLAEQGAYTGAIPTQIAEAQQATLGAAGNYANTQALGNLFTGTANIYGNEQTAAANRLAQKTPIGGPYGTTQGGTASPYGGPGPG
jgi:hypothetical protein